MRRRELIKGLLAMGSSAVATAAPGGSGVAAVAERWVFIQQSAVAGTQFYDWAQLRGVLAPGLTLELRLAASNRHDARAVEVRHQGRMLGHLPRTDNCAVSQMLIARHACRAVVTQARDVANPWDRLQVRVERRA